MPHRRYLSINPNASFWVAFPLLLGLSFATTGRAKTPFPASFQELAESSCNDCHAGSDAEARLELPSMMEAPLAEHFRDWQRVLRVMQDGSMPPEDAEDPEPSLLSNARTELHRAVDDVVQQAAQDPGPQVVRRLTNAEYEYSIEDLTGVSYPLSKLLVQDSVGASGFTNASTGQFMHDATLERYLEVAKFVADHAMLGAGPLYFHSAPGQTGFELSAIQRIQNIYRKHGFRAAAGEGAKPYGLERFVTAFTVAWKYKHRDALEWKNATLDSLAIQANLEPKFAHHVWTVLQEKSATFPLSDVLRSWNDFPSPDQVKADLDSTIEEHSRRLFQRVQDLQRQFAGSASAEEEAALLSEGRISVPTKAEFLARAIRKRVVPQDGIAIDLNDASLYSSDTRVRLRIEVEDVLSQSSDSTVLSDVGVVFSKPRFRIRYNDGLKPDPVPLVDLLSPDARQALQFGVHPAGQSLDSDSFVVRVDQTRVIEVKLPENSRLGELYITAQLDPVLGKSRLVRCTITDVTNESTTPSEQDSQKKRPKGRQYSSLLRTFESPRIDEWERGVERFAACFPQISHREPAPSDRDPIPAPYLNTYNLPERNFFHTAVKYHRDDDFLIKHVLPEDVAEELEIAWTDLLSSFDYFDVNLRFVAKKFGVELGDRTIRSIDEAWIRQFPGPIQSILLGYKSNHEAMNTRLQMVHQRHLQDVLHVASQAWRRPLSESQKQELLNFYRNTQEKFDLDHASAIRACLTRVFSSPHFLYRAHRHANGLAPKDLDDFELASKLSFTLTSSIPDEPLMALAASGRLSDSQVLREQAQRLLRSPKARRMATEFFGQWLGFYQFDEFRGIDPKQFPEFDESLRSALYEEAISLFEYILREDRPIHEIVDAPYTFVNQKAAKHYGLNWREDATDRSSVQSSKVRMEIEDGTRGGVLGLGAVLASTSAPLRTSPVKRGDWILRRILGTPVPPPPADAGSIAAEEVLPDGLTVRQRLEAHRSRLECKGCHSRIDPLGFALENYDSLGRWRGTYRDGQTIDASGLLRNGETISGLAGLKDHLREEASALRKTFATKLAAYVLGRAESVSDAALIAKTSEELRKDPRVSSALFVLLESPQFRQVRGHQSASLNEISLGR